MEGDKQISRSSSCSHGVQVPRQNAYWRIILIKESPPAGSVLHALPESIVSQNLVNEQAQQQHEAPQMHAAMLPDRGLGEPEKKAFIESLNKVAQRISELTSTLVQLEAARERREEAACRSMNLAAHKMIELVAAMTQLEAVKEERRALKRNVYLEQQLAAASSDSDASVGSTSTRLRKTRRLTDCLTDTSMQGLNGLADCCGITTVGMIDNTLTMQDEEEDASSKKTLSHG